MGLPILRDGETLDDYPKLSTGEQAFIGFNLCRGKSKPRRRFYGWNGWTVGKRLHVANQLEKIRHFKVELKDYRDIENRTATWYVDPPYQEKQKTTTEPYTFNKLDYNHLRDWALERDGQLIACGGEGDSYLPFQPLLVTGSTSNKKQYEYLYTQDSDRFRDISGEGLVTNQTKHQTV